MMADDVLIRVAREILTYRKNPTKHEVDLSTFVELRNALEQKLGKVAVLSAPIDVTNVLFLGVPVCPKAQGLV